MSGLSRLSKTYDHMSIDELRILQESKENERDALDEEISRISNKIFHMTTVFTKPREH